MHAVVLVKAVPNAAGEERLGENLRLDRASADQIINPNDEHALEVALRLAEALPGLETTMLTMGPGNAWAGLNKAIAAGIGNAVMVTDDALAGSCALATANVLAAALRRLTFDLVLAGLDSADGRAGLVASAISTLIGIPFISHAQEVTLHRNTIVARRLLDDGYELVEAQLPAVVTVTQAVGELRYPSLRNIMAARSKRPEIWTLGDLGIDAAAVGVTGATTRTLGTEPPEPRPPTRVVTGDVAVVVPQIIDFLAERGLAS